MSSVVQHEVLNPDYYKSKSGIQIINLIRLLPFSLGNTVKYVYRNQNKDGIVQDLNKALWYLNDYLTFPWEGDPGDLPIELLDILLEKVPHFEQVAVTLIVEGYYFNDRSLLEQAVKEITTYVNSLSQ